MECPFHAGNKAVTVCIQCETPICPLCATETNQIHLCLNCHRARVGELASSLGSVSERLAQQRHKTEAKPLKARRKKEKEVQPVPAARPAYGLGAEESLWEKPEVVGTEVIPAPLFSEEVSEAPSEAVPSPPAEGFEVPTVPFAAAAAGAVAEEALTKKELARRQKEEAKRLKQAEKEARRAEKAAAQEAGAAAVEVPPPPPAPEPAPFFEFPPEPAPAPEPPPSPRVPPLSELPLDFAPGGGQGVKLPRAEERPEPLPPLEEPEKPASPPPPVEPPEGFFD